MLSRVEFLIELARRRIMERHVGSSVVLLWALTAPLIPLLINLAVFYFIAQIPQIRSMGVIEYAVFIFSGLLPFRIMQSAASEASELMVSNMDMLKSVSFPLHALSLASIMAQMLDFGIQLTLLLVLLLLNGTGIGLHIMLLPLAVVLLVPFLVGMSWAISVVGYLFRELREIVIVAFSALLYLSPVMYPADATPPLMKKLFLFNPITHFVTIFRDVLFSNGVFHWKSWAIASIMSAFVFGIGYFAISRTKRFVGDMV